MKERSKKVISTFLLPEQENSVKGYMTLFGFKVGKEAKGFLYLKGEKTEIKMIDFVRSVEKKKTNKRRVK